MSTAVALLVSPVTIAFCRRKSTRVTAVMGGLVTALGCLFTSFATQFHQLFFSYGTVIGLGSASPLTCFNVIVCQNEWVEGNVSMCPSMLQAWGWA